MTRIIATNTTAPSRERFLAKVDMNGMGGCWLWTGGRIGKGYGSFRVGSTNKLAHRVAYELLVGPIPEGLQLDHLCRVRHCVNPAHLEPVTNRQNILRGVGLPAVNFQKMRCPQGHPYDNGNTHITPDGKRHCRACNRDRMTARRRGGSVIGHYYADGGGSV